MDKRVKEFADILLTCGTEPLILPGMYTSALDDVNSKFRNLLTEKERAGIYPFKISFDFEGGLCFIEYEDYLKVLDKEEELEELKSYIKKKQDEEYENAMPVKVIPLAQKQ